MQIALDYKKRRISIEEALLKSSKHYFCPCCGKNVRIRNGKVNVPHFAHISLDDCDDFTHDMSQWHRDWQNRFPEENREVIIKLRIDEKSYYADGVKYGFLEETDILEESEGKSKKMIFKHRADVCINNTVIEFQHSPISRPEFNKRNWFYTKAGYKVIWVFDLIEKLHDTLTICYKWENRGVAGGHYEWKHAARFLRDLSPQVSKDVELFFQFYEYENDFSPLMERVVYTVIDAEEGYNDYKYFRTGYNVNNVAQFKQYIMDRQFVKGKTYAPWYKYNRVIHNSCKPTNFLPKTFFYRESFYNPSDINIDISKYLGKEVYICGLISPVNEKYDIYKIEDEYSSILIKYSNMKDLLPKYYNDGGRLIENLLCVSGVIKKGYIGYYIQISDVQYLEFLGDYALKLDSIWVDGRGKDLQKLQQFMCEHYSFSWNSKYISPIEKDKSKSYTYYNIKVFLQLENKSVQGVKEINLSDELFEELQLYYDVKYSLK